VLAFHGGGGEAQGFKGYAGLDTVADREGFIVVYPNGTGVLPRRLLTWNAGECCGYAMNQRVDVWVWPLPSSTTSHAERRLTRGASMRRATRTGP
jgi:hypothetical protein